MDYVIFNHICSHLHYLFFISIFLYNPLYIFYFFFTFHVNFLPANMLVLAVIFIVLFDLSLALAR